MVKQWGFSLITLSVLLMTAGWGQLSTTSVTTDLRPFEYAFDIEQIRVSKWMIHLQTAEDCYVTEHQVNQLIDRLRLQKVQTRSSTAHSPYPTEPYAMRDHRNIWYKMYVMKHEKRNATDLFNVVLNVEAVDHSLKTLEELLHDMAIQLQRVGLQPNVHVSVQGNVPFSLSERAQSQWIRQVMEHLDATEVESLRDGNMTSISAFSPHLKTSIVSHGRRINIQIVVRSDNSTQQTVVTLGTPIITIEY